MKQLKIKNNRKRGVVLLITLTVVTIVLLLLAGIMAIAAKQSLLSSLSSESQKAFYAADTGIECVLYWELASTSDFRFATSSQSSIAGDPPNGEDFCAGQDMSAIAYTPNFQDWDVSPPDTSAATTTIWITAWSTDHENADSNNPCTNIIVEKYGPYTKVLSIGYNTCNPAASGRVTRAVHIDY